MKSIFTFIGALTLSATSSLSFADSKALDKVLKAQPEATQARYEARHPAETLAFFSVEPGMTIIEAFPGGGWYTKILLPYLGEEGKLIGVDYDISIYPKFNFFDDKYIKEKETWAEDWVKGTEEWGIEKGGAVEAYTFATLGEVDENSVDAALFIRAMHNLNRFETDGEYLSKALDVTYNALKPGGIMGVVQHETADPKADGSAGYLNRDNLIKAIEKAGFKFVESSDVNANPKDKADSYVWRLPPVYANAPEGSDARKEAAAIGESNRMTLKFIKPKK